MIRVIIFLTYDIDFNLIGTHHLCQCSVIEHEYWGLGHNHMHLIAFVGLNRTLCVRLFMHSSRADCTANSSIQYLMHSLKRKPTFSVSEV